MLYFIKGVNSNDLKFTVEFQRCVPAMSNKGRKIIIGLPVTKLVLLVIYNFPDILDGIIELTSESPIC